MAEEREGRPHSPKFYLNGKKKKRKVQQVSDKEYKAHMRDFPISESFFRTPKFGKLD